MLCQTYVSDVIPHRSMADMADIDSVEEAWESIAEITDIDVNGDRATVNVSSSTGVTNVPLRKEDGEWKFCMTDSPKFKGIPGLK